MTTRRSMVAAQFTARKQFLIVRKPRCLRCRTNGDVTLTDSRRPPARWWCVRCKYEFEFEPQERK